MSITTLALWLPLLAPAPDLAPTVAPSASALPTGLAAAPGDDVADALAGLNKLKDDADPALLKVVAKAGTREAAEALVTLYDELASIYMKREVLRALPAFDGKADAEQPVLDLLAREATSSEDRELRDAALAGLRACEHLGKGYLARIVDSAAPDEVREEAIVLHREMSDEGDQAWYRQLYELPDEDERDKRDKKKDRRKRGDDEEEEPEKVVYALPRVRAEAFAAVAKAYDDRTLVEHLGRERSALVALAQLRELAERQADEAVPLCTALLESVDTPGYLRAEAALLLAQLEGKKVAPLYIDLGRKQEVTPEVLREALATALADMGDEGVDKQTVKLLGRGKPHEKRFALMAARRSTDPKVRKKYISALKDKDEEVQALAIRILGEQQEKEAVKDLEKLLDKGKDEELMEDLLEALSRIHDGDPEWVVRLEGFVDSPTRELRNAALTELGRQKDPAQVERVAKGLEHMDWSTRLAALHALETIHDPSVLGPIVARMPEESGRPLHEFADTLFRLTGQPFRTRADAWQAWYRDHGAGFELLEPKEVRKLEAEEEARRLKMVSKVKFFGIRIESHRVIFVLDVSGSMLENLRSQYVGRTGEVRIERAKKELTKAIDQLEEGALFNVITFSSGVDAWQDSVSASSGSTRAEAKEWVQALGALGATNLHDALQKAFEDPDVDTIVVLSDGEPTAGALTDPSAIRDAVARWNQNRGVVIHAISVGGSLKILEWLAENSGGEYRRYD